VIWLITWWLLVYDSPAQHPRITEKEKTYILSKLGKTVAEKSVSVRMQLLQCTFLSLAFLRGKNFSWCISNLMSKAKRGRRHKIQCILNLSTNEYDWTPSFSSQITPGKELLLFTRMEVPELVWA
jgi:hypothetical protein